MTPVTLQRKAEYEARLAAKPAPGPRLPAGPKAGHLEFLLDAKGPAAVKLACPRCFGFFEVREIGQAYSLAGLHADEAGCDVAPSRFVMEYGTSVWCYQCGQALDAVASLGGAYATAKDHISAYHGGSRA
jgi:hypothetical protein